MTSPPHSVPAAPDLSSKLVAQAAGLIIGVTVVVFGSVIVLGFTAPSVRQHIALALAIAIPAHAVLVLAAERWILRRHRVRWRGLGFTRPTRRLLHLLWQIPAALVALLVVQGATFLLLGGTGSSGTDGAGTLGALGPFSALLVFLGTAVLTPLWEEIFFRGILFGAVRSRWGITWAVLISAVVFAAVHGVPTLLPYLVTLGLILGLLRAFHRTIWASLALHMTVNTIASSTLIIALT